MVWPILGSRPAEEQNRCSNARCNDGQNLTEQRLTSSLTENLLLDRFVGFSFFQYRANRLPRKSVSEMTYFVSSGT